MSVSEGHAGFAPCVRRSVPRPDGRGKRPVRVYLSLPASFRPVVPDQRQDPGCNGEWAVECTPGLASSPVGNKAVVLILSPGDCLHVVRGWGAEDLSFHGAHVSKQNLM